MPQEVEQHEPPPPPAEPVIGPGYTFTSVTDKIAAIVLRRGTPRGWSRGVFIAFALFMLGMFAISGLGLRTAARYVVRGLVFRSVNSP